ncbi:PREDICTED: NADPH oxidase 4-like [Papilio polytes]|uniref:NADPH oxidase 4-like n=1 Tax=Papilio polytes TaxID=76194 RepID=UPI000675DEC8|nr:PREDICTED: NADPH oxidase 4-like [Papilio polytes]
MIRFVSDCFAFIKRRVFLILWISLVMYIFYDSFIFYKRERRFYYLRQMLGLGLCISRGTATVLNLCCALVLLPLCKKLNQLLYRLLSKLWPGLFFFWLERAKSFHMTVAITLLVFAVIHSMSHFVNLWNFSRNYDERHADINLARYKNESPFLLLISMAGLTGVMLLTIAICMGLTSLRVARRRVYNAFWYTHQLYMPFMVFLMIHPLSGVLKEEVLDEHRTSPFSSQVTSWSNASAPHTKFVPIKSKTWIWMAVPLSCFLVDLLWRIFTRNLARVQMLNVCHMAGRTLSITVSCPYNTFRCRKGQYVLLQCLDVSLLEWHPFTIVKLPTVNQREFEVWIRVKGDWTEALERLILEKGASNVRILIDGPFSSPMEGVSRSDVALCVAAGVGITPFVTILQEMLINPRSTLPGRVHLLWIVRREQEIKWLADLTHKVISQLRHANRPDRLHIEFYVTSTNNNDPNTTYDKDKNNIAHVVMINEKGVLTHILNKNDKNISDDEKATLLTPNRKRVDYVAKDIKDECNDRKGHDIAKEYPLVGCRVRRGRPHWDRVFGYWVHLYPEQNLNLYCCGPKKLVKLLRNKCKIVSNDTKNKFTFIHEAFS